MIFKFRVVEFELRFEFGFGVWIVKFEYLFDFGFELLIWNLILI